MSGQKEADATVDELVLQIRALRPLGEQAATQATVLLCLIQVATTRRITSMTTTKQLSSDPSSPQAVRKPISTSASAKRRPKSIFCKAVSTN